MPRKGHTSEQIIAAIRQAKGSEKVAEVCRKFGISKATYYSCKKQYADVATSELRESRQLREENRRLKQLVADLPRRLYGLSRPVVKAIALWQQLQVEVRRAPVVAGSVILVSVIWLVGVLGASSM